MAPMTEITFYACLSVAGHLWIKPPPVYSALAFLLLLNIKAWPLSYTARLLPALIRTYVLPAPVVQLPAKKSIEVLFRAQSQLSWACPLECDINMHKSNSTYLVDLDTSRANLLAQQLVPACRALNGARLILAAVDSTFYREILPFQAYETRSRILTWDNKWIFIVTYLVQPGTEVEDGTAGLSDFLGRQREKKRLFAVALSRYVAKKGRRTVAPEDLLKAGGYTGGADGNLQMAQEREREQWDMWQKP
ncbi:unnamed protein product [Penicillium pancosmium]